MSTAKTDVHRDDEFTPERVSAIFRRIDELYVIGKQEIWDGFRRDFPNATHDQLQDMWMACLEERRRGEWGGP